MLLKSTIQLLRFHFSIFLLPVYLFALTQLPEVNSAKAALIFFILHALVYPSSNGYNSYMDRDTTSIGGVAHPLPPTRQLFYASVVMDVAAVALGFLISIIFAFGILSYILGSRAYSYRGIRIKKYPLTGYIVVVFFQGAVTFFLVYHGCSVNQTLDIPLLPMLAASCLIGGYYPLTQVYQHEEDKKDGVRTISLLLGKRGTFIYCGFVFATATLLMFITFKNQGNISHFYLFSLCMIPMIFFFINWMMKVWKDSSHANFRNSLVMNILAASCTTICFLTLIILKAFE